MVHRLLAYALYIVLGVMVAISLVSIVGNFATRGGDVSTPLEGQIRANNFQLDLGASAHQRDLEYNSPSLSLTTERLDPGLRRLSGFFTLDEPGGVLRHVFDTKTNKAVFTCPTSSDYDCVLKKQFADRKVVIDVVTASSRTGRETEIVKPISFQDAFNLNYSILGTTEIPFDIPIAGSPDLYPQDRYSLDIFYYMFLPDAYRDNDKKYPNRYTFDTGTLGANAEVVAQPLCSHGVCRKGQEGLGFHVAVKRSIQTQMYTYAVALIPFIFAVIFFHLMFLSADLEQRRFEEFTEALIVAVLSVLPLRVVLVPAEITGLTRIDLILGLGLVLIVTVAVGKYATEMRSSQARMRAMRAAAASTPPAE